MLGISYTRYTPASLANAVIVNFVQTCFISEVPEGLIDARASAQGAVFKARKVHLVPGVYHDATTAQARAVEAFNMSSL